MLIDMFALSGTGFQARLGIHDAPVVRMTFAGGNADARPDASARMTSTQYMP